MYQKRSAKLEGKKVLITAGPTWVPIDNVRVISNVATGTTGILLAEAFRKGGAEVTLLLGPVERCPTIDKRIRVVRFRYFDELRNELSAELRRNKYDALIHAAAVADYKPKNVYRGKISSGIAHLKLELIPMPKIIDTIKSIRPAVFTAAFKFEPGAGRAKLVKEANKLMRRCGADVVVANSVLKDNNYRAYLVSGKAPVCGPFFNKKDMAESLVKTIGSNLKSHNL